MSAITVLGYTYGVVDHCRFLNSHAGVIKDWNGWNRPTSFGTADAVYIENNEYKGSVHSNALDSGYGSRYVFRYNYVENTYLESHGTRHLPGVFSYEIYNNIFEEKPEGWPVFHYMYLRGGTGVVFNNTALQGDASWGWIRVNQESSCQVLDDPPTCFSYPCPNQIGRTHDHNGDGVQDLVPLYSWNNNREGEYRGIIPNGNPPQPCVTDYVREGRDYFNNTPKPGYVPYPYPHPLTVLGEAGRLLNLLATPSGSTLTLNWQPVLEAVSYHVVRDWQNDQAVIITGTSWTDPTPAAGRIYMVYALNSTGKVLAAEGKTIQAFPQSIALVPGWNWVAFLPTTAMPIATALASISGQVQEVKSLTQSATYSGGAWSGTLSQLQPGQGYAIKMSGPGTLIFPAAVQTTNVERIK